MATPHWEHQTTVSYARVRCQSRATSEHLLVWLLISEFIDFRLHYSFATGCEISEDGRDVSCTCLEGYAGELCEVCAPGYYGNPREPGNTCRPCECHGNIDTSEEGCCDRVTGECLKCLNNTYGSSCDICGPGFYGDAIIAKNCTSKFAWHRDQFIVNALINEFALLRLYLRSTGNELLRSYQWSV